MRITYVLIAVLIGGHGIVHAEEMVLIPEGYYRPLFSEANSETDEVKNDKIPVASFHLDISPVTNANFRRFVIANPKWARSSIKSLFADKNYLKSWESDFELGSKLDQDAPVTEVSWFVAKAYCRWQDKRLPTVAEWEYAATASETERYAGFSDPEFKERILQWYSKPNQDELPKVRSMYPKNVYGVYDLHGIVWEWVRDFNTALVTGESRGDSAMDKNLYCGGGAAGAADVESYATFMRYGFRSSLQARYTVSNLGFRCARDNSYDAF